MEETAPNPTFKDGNAKITEINVAQTREQMSEAVVTRIFEVDDFIENPMPHTVKQPLPPPEFTGNIYMTSPSGARVMDPAISVLVLGAAGTPIQEALHQGRTFSIF